MEYRTETLEDAIRVLEQAPVIDDVDPQSLYRAKVVLGVVAAVLRRRHRNDPLS